MFEQMYDTPFYVPKFPDFFTFLTNMMVKAVSAGP